MSTTRPIRKIFSTCVTSTLLLVGLSQPTSVRGAFSQDKPALKTDVESTKDASPTAESKSAGESSSGKAALAGSNAAGDTKKSEAKAIASGNEGQPKDDLPIWARGWLQFLTILASWPVVLLLLALYFVVSQSAPYKVARLLKPFRSLKLFGTEFVLSEEVGADAEQAIEIYRKKVKRQFDGLVETYDVRARVEAVLDQMLAVVKERNEPKDVRCTLHVPDIFFADTLYQLMDYYPSGGGRGRTFSSRFGIIGLCWRSREDEIRGAVPTDRLELVRKWGMTHEQATASGDGRQSFLVILLRDETGAPVAIFYTDSKQLNAFGADRGDEEFRTKLTQAVISGSKDRGLVASLAKMRDALKERRPAIHIHEQ